MAVESGATVEPGTVDVLEGNPVFVVVVATVDVFEGRKPEVDGANVDVPEGIASGVADPVNEVTMLTNDV